MEESFRVLQKWCWLRGSDCSEATEYEHWTGQRGFSYAALPEMSDISYTISPAKYRNQCHPSLHAEKHVAVSAGGKLRLEGEKKCSFFPLLLGGCALDSA